MKHYEDYEIEDFASDDDFINWCLQPDEVSNKLWNNWIQSHPEHQTTVLEAKQLILDLQSLETEKNKTAFELEIWEKINEHVSKTSNRSKIRKLYWATSVAASLLLLIGAYFFFQNDTSLNPNENLAQFEWINLENNSGIKKRIELADNSVIILEPFSSLKYPSEFSGDQRVVFLKGEAFFDIARDTTKPFLVYANETVTKVLGTSFRITAFEGEKTVEVEVKSGKVAVYANVDSENKKIMIVETDEKMLIPLPNKKLEVTPNQKVVFDKKEDEMIKTVAKLPQIITKLETLPQFEFEEESVVKVFNALELAYGIDLEYDEENLKNCPITTKLKDEPLFQKLSIICAALSLEFSEKDAVISIKGEGC